MRRRAGDEVRAGDRSGAERGEDRGALPPYPTSPEFTERERACIGFAEQFAIQSSAITDEDCAALQQYISPHEFVYLAKALGQMDQMQRLCVAMDVRTGPVVPTQLEGFASLVTSPGRN